MDVPPQQQSFTSPTEAASFEDRRGGRQAESTVGAREAARGTLEEARSRDTPGDMGGATNESTGQTGDARARVLTPEEVQQAFLSRMLLVLGSFVVLCLVLF